MFDDTENISEVEETVETEQETVETPPEETPQERNFRALREKTKRLERENEDLKRYAYSQPQQQPQAEEEKDDLGIGDNDLAEGKHLKKLRSSVKKLEEQNKYYQERLNESIVENKVKSKFHDFDSVVNKENMELLQEIDPDVANSIRSNSDLYAASILAYTMIKQNGITASPEQYKGNREQVLKNAAKPRPVASVGAQHGDSPLTQANAFAHGLTEDVKTKLWQEMLQIRRQS